MATKKIRIGIVFGGRSPEHEISLLSANNVIQALDPKKYDVVLIGIDKQGKWLLPNKSRPLLDSSQPEHVRINNEAQKSLALVPGLNTEILCEDDSTNQPGKLDVIFPILHGPMGEDGTIQGLLQFVGIPCVGSGVLSSAVCMDKEVTKRLLLQAGLPTARFISLRAPQKDSLSYQSAVKQLGTSVMFVKPANLGSSIGINKVKDEASFKFALEDAFKYDHKILIEEAIIGREVEVAVLGNDDPEVSVPGEVVPNDEFYTFKAKYAENGLKFIVPAPLPPQTVEALRRNAKEAFITLSCQGMARVDFFVRGEEVFISELNTIPGFTSTSAFPKLWAASGIPYADLIERLISLAMAAHKQDQALKRNH